MATLRDGQTGWGMPSSHGPCADFNDPEWYAAFDSIPKENLRRARQALTDADNRGGFWLHVAKDEEVACEWLWVADGGRYGGRLIDFTVAQGWYKRGSGKSPAGQNQGQAAGDSVGNRAKSAMEDSIEDLRSWAANNPLMAAAVVGLGIFVLARK